MKPKSWLFPILLTALLSSLFTAVLTGAIPVSAGLKHEAPNPISYPVISYQGQVTVSGQPYTGNGYFKFSIVDDGGSMYWSNDGTGAGGTEPSASILLPVSKGLFTVLLGDTNNGMLALTNNVFASNPGRFLRVWFSATGSAFTKLTPDRRFTWTPYSMTSDYAFTLEGYTVSNLKVPSGAMVLGYAEETGLSTDLLDNGYQAIGVSNVSAWSPTTTSGAPSARYYHTAVWTGSEMIIWGGMEHPNTPVNTGARYNPSSNTWTTMNTSGAPSARFNHTAVWTGSEMIVWGGTGSNTGGRYNPNTDSWTTMNTIGAPSGSQGWTAVWSGVYMIVWGNGTGGLYNPTSNTWGAMSSSGAPTTRTWHSAVWTGSEMIIWGGQGAMTTWNDGARYNPTSNTWASMNSTNAPSPRYQHAAIWTGSEMIIWGGWDELGSDLNTGGRYNPATNQPWWTLTTDNAPMAGSGQIAVWTGNDMLVWGGGGGGGAYNPLTFTWSALPNGGAPSVRSNPTTVWSGAEMIVWGGYGGGVKLNTGGRLIYNLTLFYKP